MKHVNYLGVEFSDVFTLLSKKHMWKKRKKGGRQGVGRYKQMHQMLKLFDLSKKYMVLIAPFLFSLFGRFANFQNKMLGKRYI